MKAAVSANRCPVHPRCGFVLWAEPSCRNLARIEVGHIRRFSS
jgi:hypothetical protein